MANFVLSCDAFVRMAAIIEGYSPGVGREELLSVFIRHKNGLTVAVATNSKIAAFEFIGETQEPDGGLMVIPDPALVQQCKTEIAFNGFLTIQTNDILQFATAKTTLGYNHPTNAAIWGASRDNIDWIFQQVSAFTPTKKQNGVMHWYADSIAKLANSTPSGRIIFPRIFDAEKPLLLRDPLSENWTGLFIPQMNDFDKSQQPNIFATTPEWFE